MFVRYPSRHRESAVTPYQAYLNRRQFLRAGAGVGAAVATVAAAGPAAAMGDPEAAREAANGMELTAKSDALSYNNFLELGSGKEAPKENAHLLPTDDWTVTVDGLVNRPMTFGMDDLTKRFPPGEHIHRLRCVEAWSMVLPWQGFPLKALLDLVEPLGKAGFVAFRSIHAPEKLPNQGNGDYPWPYSEGLRLDEARNPLTLLATGLYGESLPPQNGAPVRLVVPWKYGFKSAKSITHITLVEDRPETFWHTVAPEEYGFYANVNPDVDHPRWSQARERRIGDLFKQPTEMFNGYGDEVAHLYAGMDLKKHY